MIQSKYQVCPPKENYLLLDFLPAEISHSVQILEGISLKNNSLRSMKNLTTMTRAHLVICCSLLAGMKKSST